MGFLPSTVGIKKNTRKYRKRGVWPQIVCFLMRGFHSTSATVNCRVAMESIWTIKNQPSSCTTTNGTLDVFKGKYIHSSIYHGIQNVQKPFAFLRRSEEEEEEVFCGNLYPSLKNPYFPGKIPINYVKHHMKPLHFSRLLMGSWIFLEGEGTAAIPDQKLRRRSIKTDVRGCRVYVASE